jgi:hypothetical protein
MPGQITVPTPGSVLQGPILSDFVPKLNLIQNVSNSERAVVTTVSAHGYSEGIYVRVNVPDTYGMDIFEQTMISIIDSTSFTTEIDTSNMDPFVAPSSYPPVGFTPAQVVPMGGTTDNIA